MNKMNKKNKIEKIKKKIFKIINNSFDVKLSNIVNFNSTVYNDFDISKNINNVKLEKNNLKKNPNSICKLSKDKINDNNFDQLFKKNNSNIIIGENTTLSELANKMKVSNLEIINITIKLGILVTLNQIIDQKTSKLIAEKLGYKVILLYTDKFKKNILTDNIYYNKIIKSRPPIVTIMGHVDHGKTSLLNSIRSIKKPKYEVGGITQYISVYNIELNNKKKITFLDTPGHVAFTSMRIRGMQVTDIVVLVIAADDGVMPQTIESIKYAQVIKVPIIVVINKIDKTESNFEKIKDQLMKYNIIPEEWGGDNQFINISAKSGFGIDNLLEAINLQSEILELKAVINCKANGIVIESFLDKKKGPVAFVLVIEGIFRIGDIILCGFEYGKIRNMCDPFEKNIFLAGPSIPVKIFGLSAVPIVGDKIVVLSNEKKARQISLDRKFKFKEIKLIYQNELKFNDISFNFNKLKLIKLNIILKSDTYGCAESINYVLENLSTNNIKINIINFGVGNINENDAILAKTVKGVIIGFNVKADLSALNIINLNKLKVYYFSVIYDLIDKIEKILKNISISNFQNEIIGIAEICNIFNSPKFGLIIGCIVKEGVIKRNNKLCILRKNTVIYHGTFESLRRFKKDVDEVYCGMECGIGMKNFIDVKKGDIIKIFKNI